MKDARRRQGGPASSCAACKLLRRRCATDDCVFAPYFPAGETHKFASVHKVFGASNVNKMLQELPEYQRADAVSSMVYEANARARDPVYGCVGAISSLQQQIDALQTQLALAQAEIVNMRMRQLSCITNSPDNLNAIFSMDMVEDQGHVELEIGLTERKDNYRWIQKSYNKSKVIRLK